MLPLPEQPRPGNLPWVCLTFFALGLAVLLVVQRGDAAREQALASWYRDSGLFALEWPNYVSWLRINGQATQADTLQQALRGDDLVTVVRHMGYDPAFERENLQRGDQYWSPREWQRWQHLRDDFRTRSRAIASRHYALTPSAPRPGTWLTWHVLQPSFAHWLVALLVALPFLWPLEAELGHRRMAILWLLAGAVTALALVGLMPDSHRPLLGSMTMTSALTGMYLGLFARRRLPVRWFHPRERRWRAGAWPAATFAPLWLALPLWIWSRGGEEMAGLLLAQALALPIGAGLVHLVRRDTAEDGDAATNEEEDAAVQLRRHLSAGWNGMSALAFAEAEQAFEAALALSPGHFHALTGLYHLRKLQPDSDAFLQTAVQALGAPVDGEGDIRQQLMLYRDLHQRDRADRLPLEVAVPLLMRFTRIAELRDAEQLAQALLARRQPHPLLPKALHALAAAFQQLNDDARASRYRTLADNLAAT